MDEIKDEQTSSMAEIFINLLSFFLLGITATAAGFLYFQVINKYFPDVLSLTYNNYQISSFNRSVINYSIASLIVGFPIYLWALWFWFRSFNQLTNGLQKMESKLSKWLTYIILFIASGTIIGDLITVIYNFLQGEYGARFLLKALTILVIAGFVFGFYFFERKKIQYKKEVSTGYFITFSVLSGLVIIIAIVLGFIAGGTPGQARLRNFDLQRVNDLEQISSCISNFAYDNGRLPASFDELKTNARYSYCAGRTSDMETGKDYEYRIISEKEYELCAEFSLSGSIEFQSRVYSPPSLWENHDQGRVCYKQIVNFKQPNTVSPPLPTLPLKLPGHTIK